MKIDRNFLKLEIAEVTEKLKAVKKTLRTPHQPGVSWRTFSEFRQLKAQATTLCSISAHCRGKIHLPTVKTLEEQYAYISEDMKRFLVEESVAA